MNLKLIGQMANRARQWAPAALMASLLGVTTPAQSQELEGAQFPSECTLDACEIWFPESGGEFTDTTALEVYTLEGGNVEIDQTPYSAEAGVVEYWLLDAADNNGAVFDWNQYRKAATELVAGIEITRNAIFLRQLGGDRIKVDTIGRPTAKELSGMIDKVSFKFPKDFSEDDLNLALTTQFEEFVALSNKYKGRGVFYWVTSRAPSAAILASLRSLHELGEPDSTRIVVLPFTDDKKTQYEEDFDSLLIDIPGFAAQRVAKLEQLPEAAHRITTMLLNGITMGLMPASDAVCGEQRLYVGSATGPFVNFPQCAAALTACQADPQSDACLDEQFNACALTPENAGCRGIILDYCYQNPNGNGCYSQVLDHCQENPNDERYDCTDRVRSYCERNPLDQSANCGAVLAQACEDYERDDPRFADNECQRRLAVDFCDLQIGSDKCDRYVTNYCFDNPNLAGCEKPLEESCWSNQNDPGCAERLFQSCSKYRTFKGCNDILVQQCQAGIEDPICEEVMLGYCELNEDAPGCKDRIVQECLDNPTLFKCEPILDDYCWSDRTNSVCGDNLIKQCTADPLQADCGEVLLDYCAQNPENGQCGGWSGIGGYGAMHCANHPTFATCEARSQRIVIYISAAAALLLLLITVAIVRAQLKKVPKSAGTVYVYIQLPGEDESIEYQLTKKTTWVGRGEAAEIQVEDNAMSKIHAQIQYRDGEFYLADMQSLNGVFLNQEKISDEVPLKPGSMISVGGTNIRFEIYANN